MDDFIFEINMRSAGGVRGKKEKLKLWFSYGIKGILLLRWDNLLYTMETLNEG